MRDERGACVVKVGVCMVKGGHAWYAPPPPRDMASHCTGGTHPTGMHSCFFKICHEIHTARHP